MKIYLLTFLQTIFFIAIAPLFAGIVKRCKCFMQNRKGPSVFQPYRNLLKLFRKQALRPENASFIFSLAPCVVFVVAVFVCSLVPLCTSSLVTSSVADVIVIVGLLALSRFFLVLAGLDIGTAFGGMGASREMMIATLAEPALMMAFFTVAIQSSSTNLSNIASYLAAHSVWLHPSLLFTGVGFALIAVAETGRIPVDNPATHLELTMIHEAMILEYSGRDLALIEWAAQIKLLFFMVLLANLFFPWSVTASMAISGLVSNILIVFLKLIILAVALVFVEVNLAKLRVFRVPLLLNMAFILCLLGLLNYVILEAV